MELTNYSAIDIRGQFATAEPELARTMERLGTGKRINRSSDDPGVTAIAMKKHSGLTRNHSVRTGLQNAISYANMQHEGLKQVGEIYHRMGELAQSSLDVMKNNDDRGALDKEFNELVGRLIKIRDDKFNGVNLFDPLVSCNGGAPVDFSDGLKETYPPDYTSEPEVVDPSGKKWGKMWESAADVHAYDGKLTLDVNGGVAPERYVVRQGDTVIFDSGEWHTNGSAYKFDYDKFVIDFGLGKPTTFEFVPSTVGDGTDTRGANKSDPSDDTAPVDNGVFDNESFTLPAKYGGGTSGYLSQLGGIASTAALSGQKFTNQGQVTIADAPGDSTILKIQVYSDTLFQADARFDPEVINNDKVVHTDIHGETMTIDSLGFGTMSGFSVKTVADAQSTLEKLYGQTGDGTQSGEVHCLLTEQQSKAAAHISRLNAAIDKLRVNQVNEERILSTIEDADFAMESTRLARHSMKMDLLNNMLATATRMTDVLMPLAAQRPGAS